MEFYLACFLEGEKGYLSLVVAMVSLHGVGREVEPGEGRSFLTVFLVGFVGLAGVRHEENSVIERCQGTALPNEVTAVSDLKVNGVEGGFLMWGVFGVYFRRLSVSVP